MFGNIFADGHGIDAVTVTRNNASPFTLDREEIEVKKIQWFCKKKYS